MTSPTRERRVGIPTRHALPSIALAAILAASFGIAIPGHASAAAPAPVDRRAAPPAAGQHAAAITSPFAADITQNIAPSVVHQAGRIVTDNAGGQAVNVVTARAGDPSIRIEASLATGEAVGRATVTHQALAASSDGHRVIAAMNADVWAGYSSPTQDAPNGVHVQDGELMVSSTDHRKAFAVDASGRAHIGVIQVGLTVTASDGIPQPVDRLNQLRRAGEIAMYTSRFGSTTPREGSGIEVVLQGLPGPLTLGATIPLTVVEVRDAGSQPIGPGDVILNGMSGGYLDMLVPGTTVTLQTTITPGFETSTQLVTGPQMLVSNGQMDISSWPATAGQLQPRTAIGVSANGDVILATVDGRQAPFSTGVTDTELAQLMLAQGATDAISFDSGGSTQMDVREPGDVEVSVANSPSDGSERPVANAILVVSTTPTGPATQLVVRPAMTTLYVGEKVTFTAKAIDAAYNGVPIDGGSIAWTGTGATGTLTPTGRFVATAAGAETITANAAGLTGQLPVNVMPDTVAPVMTGNPISRLTANTSLTPKAVPLTVAWPPATDRGTGLAAYEAQVSSDGGASWKAVKLPTPMSTKVLVYAVPGDTMRLRVRALDKAGNTGEWAQGLRFRVVDYQDASGEIDFSGTWKATRSSPTYGGSIRYTLKKGSATFAFTASQVAWVSLKGPGRGEAQVIVDGKAAATVDGKASRNVVRRVVFVKLFTGTGRHEIVVKALGTKGRPRVDMDAFVVVVPVGN